MAIFISNTNGLNTVNLTEYNANIIHSDKSILIVLAESKIVDSLSPDFYLPQEKLVCSVVGENVGKDFHAKAWVVDSEFNGTSVLKFYADAQDWFEAVNLDLSYEYNEYVVGYVVTDKITGRFVNFQFKDNGALDYGLEGEETYKAFEEKELKAIKHWLRSHDDVDALEDIYAAAMELPKDEYGFHPIVNILATGNGITQFELRELAEQANNQ